MYVNSVYVQGTIINLNNSMYIYLFTYHGSFIYKYVFISLNLICARKGTIWRHFPIDIEKYFIFIAGTVLIKTHSEYVNSSIWESIKFMCHISFFVVIIVWYQISSSLNASLIILDSTQTIYSTNSFSLMDFVQYNPLDTTWPYFFLIIWTLLFLSLRYYGCQ